MTPAIRVLREHDVEYAEHVFDYERHPGAIRAADAIGIDPHLTAKTIVFATSEGGPVVVVMHGDREVSTKSLARELGVKSVRPATPNEGRKWTGYEFGGTSPIGMRTRVEVLVEGSLMTLEKIYINAGSRGFLVAMDPEDLVRVTEARLVDVAAG